MPTRHPRIQVTEDPELTQALRVAAPHLTPGLSRAGQVRELALTGARQLATSPAAEADRRRLLEQLAASFDQPDPRIDWDGLRETKQRAWRSF